MDPVCMFLYHSFFLFMFDFLSFWSVFLAFCLSVPMFVLMLFLLLLNSAISVCLNICPFLFCLYMCMFRFESLLFFIYISVLSAFSGTHISFSDSLSFWYSIINVYDLALSVSVSLCFSVVLF